MVGKRLKGQLCDSTIFPIYYIHAAPKKMKVIEKISWNAFTYFLVDDKVLVFEILRFLFRHKYNFLIASPLRVHVTRRCHLRSFVNLF